MAIGESRVLYDRSPFHGRYENNEEVNKAKDVILGFELLFGSHGSSDSSSLFSSDASPEDFIEVDVKNVVGSVLPNPTPHLQMMEQDGRIPKAAFVANESLDPVEWSVDSNESLFSIHHSTNSFGGDQTLLLASKICTPDDPTIPSSLPLSPLPASYREAKISEDKTKQCGGNKDKAKQTNTSHRSNESDSSSYSFAFPILVPGLQQNDTSKSGVNTQHSREEGRMDGEDSISRPSPTPPSQTKHRWCCCFPFCSCCKPRR